MAPVMEYSGESTAAECDCRDLLQKLDLILKLALKTAAKTAVEDLLSSDFHDLGNHRGAVENPLGTAWRPTAVHGTSQGATMQIPPTNTPLAEERLPVALIRAVVLVTVIAILLLSTCRLVMHFIIRTYHFSD